jgi:KDO2-lipid IV(A) lauroyltransferase
MSAIVTPMRALTRRPGVVHCAARRTPARMKAQIVKLLFRLLAALPLRTAHALGDVLGRLLVLIPNRRRNTARTNIGLCFPAMRPAQQAQLLRTTLTEYAKGVTEIGVLWTRDRDEILTLVRQLSGADDFNRALSLGKGVILAIPHLGSWELVGLYGSIYSPMTSLFRPPPLSDLGDVMRRGRERFGAQLVATRHGGVRALHKALKRGELIAILPDQVPAEKRAGEFAPFFGIPAFTMTLLSRLAAKSGAPVFFVYAERLTRGAGYHLHFLRAPAAVSDADVKVSVPAVNAMIEQCVRSCPEQYQWVYKRFRVRPYGAVSYYDN